MKKMRNGRRGFTLLEIVIVVAIIVILSTGAFLGVAATVNRASDAQEQLAINNGENFEVYARNQVNSYGKNMVYWDPIPNYTPENQAKKMKEQMIAEGWTDGEITFEYQTDGWHIIAEWDPTIKEHRGFQTAEDYKLWLSNYNNFIKQGYTIEEIEAGCKNGSTDITPVWDPSKHNNMTREQYEKSVNGTTVVVTDKDTTPSRNVVATATSGQSFDGTHVDTKTVSSGGGVYSVTEYDNGVTTVSLGTSSVDNRVGFNLEKVGNDYILSPSDDGNAGAGWYTLPSDKFPDTWKFQPYTLNSDQIAWLKQYGITLS
jgi:prepilin-type N-terminal cleavage/methylation domain-containing protein